MPQGAPRRDAVAYNHLVRVGTGQYLGGAPPARAGHIQATYECKTMASNGQR
jgi:hypothetical protein